jgi:hypothetical protein
MFVRKLNKQTTIQISELKLESADVAVESR